MSVHDLAEEIGWTNTLWYMGIVSVLFVVGLVLYLRRRP